MATWNSVYIIFRRSGIFRFNAFGTNQGTRQCAQNVVDHIICFGPAKSIIKLTKFDPCAEQKKQSAEDE